MIARIRRRLVCLLSAFARGGLRYSGRRRYLESALRVVLLVVLGIAVAYGGYIAFGLLLGLLGYLVRTVVALVSDLLDSLARMVVVLVEIAVVILVLWAFISSMISPATAPKPKSRDILDRYQRPVAGPPPGSDAPKKPRR